MKNPEELLQKKVLRPITLPTLYFWKGEKTYETGTGCLGYLGR
ncbi:MAG: hypothetical protein ACOCQN_04065 [Halanaerobiaceae bacterium]